MIPPRSLTPVAPSPPDATTWTPPSRPLATTSGASIVTRHDTISSDNNWPFGASMAALMLVVSLAVVLLYGRLLRRQFEGWRVAR